MIQLNEKGAQEQHMKSCRVRNEHLHVLGTHCEAVVSQSHHSGDQIIARTVARKDVGN